ncbi:hypothetical protein J6590_066647 [Homalodisca vitripennis]|nr:hypothetical protein J6590_066647 [Homalodisca vitripennis]
MGPRIPQSAKCSCCCHTLITTFVKIKFPDTEWSDAVCQWDLAAYNLSCVLAALISPTLSSRTQFSMGPRIPQSAKCPCCCQTLITTFVKIKFPDTEWSHVVCQWDLAPYNLSCVLAAVRP